MSTDQTNTRPTLLENGFYFQRPELGGDVSKPTELIVSLGAFASRMALEERTRVEHLDGRPENVAEHAHMLSRVGTGMVRMFRDRLPAEITEGDVALFSDVHDDVEAYVLDTATDRITLDGLRQKEIREAAGARQLVLEFKDIDPVYAARIVEYEAQINPSARLTRLIDKFMPILVHVANGGRVIRKTFDSKSSYLESIYTHSQRLREQFPEFAWLLEYRDELAEHAADLAFDPQT